jgi:hypothetical protein
MQKLLIRAFGSRIQPQHLCFHCENTQCSRRQQQAAVVKMLPVGFRCRTAKGEL